MKRFLTIFPEAQNVHLIKDVGIIAYVLKEHYGYHSTFSSYKNGDYYYLDKLKGLNQVFIKKIFNSQLLDVAIFLLFNFRKYDVINIFQLRSRSGLWAVLFKLLTLNRGKVYLKLDSDERIYDYKPEGIKRIISNFVFSKIDLVSVENKTYANYLTRENVFNRKVVYLPNGYYDFHNSEPSRYCEKENLIITVGRIGTSQKATEVLCKAFALFAGSNSSWRLEIIGPVEENFKPFINQYFLHYPQLQKSIHFIGEISDRVILEYYYTKAKIFVLTSRWEGFPNVFPEAIRKGCFIISTDIPAARDITNDQEFGELFEINDHLGLADKFKAVCSDEARLERVCKEVQVYAQQYNWIAICKQIKTLLD